MSRPEANLNRFADGILEILRRHAETYPDLWKTPPVTWVRDLDASVEDMPGPVLAVSLNGEGQPLDMRNLGSQKTRYTLTCAVYMKPPIGSDRAAGDMLADLWRVLTQNRQLKLPPATADQTAGIDDPSLPTLASGFISLGQFRIDAQGGEAVIQQDVNVEWVWSGDQP